MHVVLVGVQEADGEGLDACGLGGGADAVEGGFLHRQQHLAIGGDAFGHLEAQRARHQRLGALHVEVVLLEAMFVGHFEGIAESLGGHQRGLCALAFDQRVGGEGRAVDHQGEVGGGDAGLRQDGGGAFQHRAFRRVWRGQDLGGQRPVRQCEDEVGEGAADIDGQARGLAHHVPCGDAGEWKETPASVDG